MEHVDPNGASGAETSSSTTEVVTGAVAGDIQIIPVAEPPSGEPEAGRSDDVPEGTDPPAEGADPVAEATDTAEAEAQADLEQYPESVRDYLKGLSQEQRKTLHEHFGQRERERMEAERKRADDAEAAVRAAETKAAEVRATQGKFIGETPIDLIGENGELVTGPTYDELSSSLQTRRGREALWTKYGLDEDRAEAVKAELDQRRGMLTSSAQHFEDAAWNDLAIKFRAGLEAINGVDAEAAVAGASGPHEVLARVASMLDERHGREMAAQKRDFEGRIAALTANGEGMKGRVVAAEARRLPTGGRTGGADTRTTLQRLKDEAGSEEAFIENAKNGMYAGIDLSK